MPKVKAPLTAGPYKAVQIGPNKWEIKVGRAMHFSVDGIQMAIVQILSNEAYAHGYRNGVRKGKK